MCIDELVCTFSLDTKHFLIANHHPPINLILSQFVIFLQCLYRIYNITVYNCQRIVTILINYKDKRKELLVDE